MLTSKQSPVLPMSKAQRFLDSLTRHQIYLEGVKLRQAQVFNIYLLQLKEELHLLFRKLEYEKLSDMNKGTFIALIKQLREIQSRIYDKYTTQLLKDLLEFMQADLELSKIIFVSINEDFPNIANAKYSDLILEKRYEEKEDKTALFPLSWITTNTERLFSAIQNAPLPANGILPLDFINGFVDSASNSIENSIRQGYANKDLTIDVLNSVIGTNALNYRDGQLNKIYNQNAAVTETSMQHISAIVQASVASVIFNTYKWLSVLDNRTTEICRKRNGNIYVYGKGPLPPAHIRCRSKVVPTFAGDTVEAPESFYMWANNQPEEVKRDILQGQSINKASSFEVKTALTIEQFKNKLSLILKR